MDKCISFRWILFTDDSEEYIGSYADRKMVINFTSSTVGLTQIVKAAKFAEKQEHIKIILGDSCVNGINIKGLTDPIQLIESFETDDYNANYVMLGEGPSVQWLLDNKKDLNNANTNKTFYIDDMVMYFELFDDGQTIMITLLKVEDTDYILEIVEDKVIEWLGYKTFDTFLATYGYIDKHQNKYRTLILTLYKAAIILGFKNPEEAVAYFCDKHMIAGLKLKGVFEAIEEH